MKKLLSLFLLLTLTIIPLTSCQVFDSTQIRIGYMSGPTAMGMAKLIADNGGKEGSEKYSFTAYADTALAKADLTKGEVDIICLPTNEAVVYYKSADSNTRILAINCLNSLFLISDKDNSVSSLAELEGKTIYTCKNGTPKMVLEYIISELDLNITVSTTTPDGTKELVKPDDVKNEVINGSLPYAVIPEPLITAAQLAIASNGKNDEIAYSVDIDLGDEWDKISPNAPVTMGCIVTTQSFIDENPALLESFLNEYESSVNFVGSSQNLDTSAQYIADAKIMGAVPAAKKALGNLCDAISYIDGAEMREALDSFLTKVGLPVADDNFYYEK